MKHILLYFALLIITACSKNKDEISGPLVSYHGKLIDDGNGQPLINAVIRVEGVKRTGGVWFGSDYTRQLGSARTDGAGNFNLVFTKWNEAGHFNYSFDVIPGYYQQLFSLDAGNVYSADTIFRFTRQALLEIHFKNISPADLNDGLKFYTGTPVKLNGYPLMDCDISLSSGNFDQLHGDFPILGNANGVQRCPAGADRKYYIDYIVRKGGVVNYFHDSIFCARDITNVYNLNY